MIIISIVAGLLSTMNIWTVSTQHIRFHLNDLYMALLMTGWMVLLDSLYHYTHNPNLQVPIISILFIGLIIYLIRTQAFITDSQFIKGMIPHHSMAILMSENIKQKSNNKQIIQLANNIITTQNKEITLMNHL